MSKWRFCANVKEEKNNENNMVQKITKGNQDSYVCEECGFKYQDQSSAQECEEACKTKGICRSDLAKKALAEVVFTKTRTATPASAKTVSP